MVSDNDIFYLMEDNTIGLDEGNLEVWIVLYFNDHGLPKYEVEWHEEHAQHLVDIMNASNDDPTTQAKIMYHGRVQPVE